MLFLELHCFSYSWERDFGGYLVPVKSKPVPIYLQGAGQQIWCVHVCSPSESWAHGLCYHWFPLMVADRLSALSQPGSWAEQFMKFLFRILIIDDDLCEPPWGRAASAGKVSVLSVHWQSWGCWAGAGDPTQVTCNPGLVIGSLDSLLCLYPMSLKTFQEHYIKESLLKNIVVLKNTFEGLI